MRNRNIPFLLLCAVLFIGCDNTYWEGETPEPPPDPSDIGRVQLSFPANSITYPPDRSPQLTGTALVTNHYNRPLSGILLDFCVSDERVGVAWGNPDLRNVTDGEGRVNFRLWCTNCAGDVTVVTSCVASGESDAGWVDGKTVTFIQEGHVPVSLHAEAIPETLYADKTHLDSTQFQVTLLDAASQPVTGCNVYSIVFREMGSDNCRQGWRRTNQQGIAADYHEYDSWGDYPYHLCYQFFGNGLMDSACVTVMPWDSTR